MKFTFVFNLILFFCLCNTFITGQTYSNDFTPQRIILNLTESPHNSVAVTWRTLDMVDTPYVQYAKSTAGTKFSDDKTTIIALTQKFAINDSVDVFHYSAVINNLESNSLYVYRVGNASDWSEWNQFQTARSDSDPFEFVYLGDPQNQIKSYCSRIFRKAFQESPNAAFWLFAGDLVTDPIDSLWDEFFYAGDFIFRTIPSIMAAGNHDHNLIIVDGKKKRSNVINPIWNAHFTLPENGLNGLEELSYYVDYQGVRFIILESQARVSDQAIWLDDVLSNNPNKWTIITFHHPLYSTGSDRKNPAMQDTLLNVFDKFNVDLVLQGHDHAYGRTYKMYNNQVVDEDEKGTVFVVSMSGPKFYDINPINDSIMVKMGGEIQLFQKIKIDGNKLHFQAITANGELFDEFVLKK